MAAAERRFATTRGRPGALLLACAGACLLACGGAQEGTHAAAPGAMPGGSATCDSSVTVAFSEVQSVVARRCTSCHSPSGEAGTDYDWTSDRALVSHRRNVAAEIAQDSMPPSGSPRLSPEERRTLLCWGQAPGD